MNENEKNLEEIKDEELEEVMTSDEGETQTPSEVVEEEQQAQPDEIQEETVEEIEEQPRMFTQEQLNEIVGRTRMETRDKFNRDILERYGVNTEDELNEIFGRGQAYDVLNGDFNNINNELAFYKAENALLKSGISRDRWEDAKLILKGKGMDVTEENISLELATHPEWMGVAQTQPQEMGRKPFSPEIAEQIINTPKNVQQNQTSTIRKFGSGVPEVDSQNEDSTIDRLFGLL